MARKQKVLLIRASYLPGRLGYHVVPPIGILTLAGALRKSRPNDVEFRVLDMGIERYGAPETSRVIADYKPDVLGISALSLEAVNLHRLAKSAKEMDSRVTVVIGGPHSSSFYDEALKDHNVDYAVVGEGEESFIELLDFLRDGGKNIDMPGVAHRVDGEVRFPGGRPGIEDLDSLPMPAWDLVDLPRYSRLINMNITLARSPYAALFTSRACPYRCIYCHGIFGKKFRAQSPERVLEEIELLTTRHGARELHFYDDVFNFDRDRAMAIAEGVIRRGIDVKFAFPNGVRGDLMPRELVTALARAGAYSINYAIETASPRLQRLIRKNMDLDKLFQAIEWTFDEGMIPGGFFMFGFPSETREEMEQTIRFACRSKILKAQFFSVVPFPRTGLYDLAREMYPDHNIGYDFTPGMYYTAKRQYYTEVSGINVESILHRAWIKFYLDPWRMWHIMRRVPKNATFLHAVFLSATRGFMSAGRKEESIDMEGS